MRARHIAHRASPPRSIIEPTTCRPLPYLIIAHKRLPGQIKLVSSDPSLAYVTVWDMLYGISAFLDSRGIVEGGRNMNLSCDIIYSRRTCCVLKTLSRSVILVYKTLLARRFLRLTKRSAHTKAAKEAGYVLAITADHGNAEQMINLETGAPIERIPRTSLPFIVAGGIKLVSDDKAERVPKSKNWVLSVTLHRSWPSWRVP